MHLSTQAGRPAGTEPDPRGDGKAPRRAPPEVRLPFGPMTHLVTLIPGDGIGPEVAEAARRVVAATGVEVSWDVQQAGAGVMGSEGTPLPERVLRSIRRSRTALKGPITTP